MKNSVLFGHFLRFFVVSLMLGGSGLEAKPLDDLFAAIEAGNIVGVDAALNQGANPFQKRHPEVTTALHYALKEQVAQNRDSAILTMLLANHKATQVQGADINAKDQENRTPLHYAVQIKCEDAIPVLLDYGADIEAIANKKKTALHSAVEQESFKIARLLISRGANIEAQDSRDNTCLHYAVGNSRYEMLKVLLEAFDKKRQADAASQRTSLMGVAVLLVKTLSSALSGHTERSAINVIGQKGLSPLGLALDKMDTKSIGILLEHHANLTMVNKDGDSALRYCIKKSKLVSFMAVLIYTQSALGASVPEGASDLEIRMFTAALAARAEADIQSISIHDKRKAISAAINAVLTSGSLVSGLINFKSYQGILKELDKELKALEEKSNKIVGALAGPEFEEVDDEGAAASDDEAPVAPAQGHGKRSRGDSDDEQGNAAKRQRVMPDSQRTSSQG